MTLLDATGLSVRRGARDVVRDATLRVAAGEVVGLIGPNGAGKTTLMRAALGLMPHLGASSLARLPARQRARAASWLPQTREVAWPVPVRTLVGLGRLPYRAPGTALTQADHDAVAAALTRMDLTALADRPATELSGGELARALIARALAQETPLMMADEPVAGLDPAHQIATMEVFCALAGDRKGVLVSLHDLGLATRHCTRLVLMNAGRIVADGPPDAVLTDHILAEVFGLKAWFAQTDEGPVFQPLSLIR